MKLIQLRKQKKITQWDMKVFTGIHQSKISLIERGYVTPTDQGKKIIAQTLGKNVADIEWPEPVNGKDMY